jgi:hypothetical protein
LRGWTIDSGRLCIWFQLGHSFKIRLISRFVGRSPDRLRRRRFLDGRRRYGRLAGVQDNLFRPFARRFDTNDRSINGWRLISDHRGGFWQTPAGDEQQSRKRASNEDEIAGYGHRLSLLQIEQLGLPQGHSRKAERTTGLAPARSAQALQ